MKRHRQRPVRAGRPAADRSSAPSSRVAGEHTLPTTATTVPAQAYDPQLVEACRRMWRHGDWAGLLEVPLDQVEAHPRRAVIALMLASAHLAEGQAGSVRQLVSLARQWGAEHRLIVNVMLAGVHHSLARAALAGGRSRDMVVLHGRAAVSPLGGNVRAAFNDRLRSQIEALDLNGDVLRWVEGSPAAPALMPPVKAPELKAVEAQIAKSGKLVQETIQQELANAVKQLEAHSNLQSYLSSGLLVPELHGWPISPDFALTLVRLIEQHRFDAVVEFGSGSSTALMAKALARRAVREPEASPTVQIALEHLEQYHRKTERLLEADGLGDRAKVLLTPLSPFTTEAGATFSYYGIAPDALARELGAIRSSVPRILAVVDGPPESTGPLARYPALELLLSAIPQQHCTLVLDDYRRASEQEVARRWHALLASRGLQAELEVLPLEKHACVLRFDTSSRLADATATST